MIDLLSDDLESLLQDSQNSMRGEMNSFYNWLAVVLISLAFSYSSVAQPKRDMTREEPYHQQLQKIAPGAVDSFKAATQSLDSGDSENAIRLYNEVLKQAPNFEPAMRRVGYALVDSGRRDEGLAALEKVLGKNRSADNLVGVAVALLKPVPGQADILKSDLEGALSLVLEASKIPGENDVDNIAMIADLSLRLDKMGDFDNALARLKSGFPGQMPTFYFNGIKLANDGKFDAAISEIKAAQAAGLDEAEASVLIASIEKARDEAYPLARYTSYFYGFLGLVALWAAGLTGLFIVGRILSKRTLTVIETSDANDMSGGGHASLKLTYRRLITFAGLYYYISQPIIVALVVVVTGGIVFLFFMAGRIPIGFVIGLIVVGGGSIFYMFKSLIIRPKIEDPGRVLERAEAPRLWELVTAVAGDVKTRPIDEIRVTPGVELAVYERGKLRQKLNDKGERILIIGAGSLNGFSTNAFRAVLAHEYGHFSGRDTAGGDVAFWVNSDMARLAEAMVNSETNTYTNLAFHFLRLYHFIFRRITHGASRLQEVLADRVAVHNYGAAAFTEGLKHVVRQEIVFNKIADGEISAALTDRRKFENLYNMDLESDNSADIEETFKTEFDRPTTEDDTHPAGADRVRLAEKIEGQVHEDIKGEVWELFADREQLTKDMNLMIEKIVRGDRYLNYHDMGIAEAGR